MNNKDFKNPTAMFRPAPFWSWNDKLEKDELMRQIDEMADKGWGSYFMHSRVGLVTDYLSDEWMALINACAKRAKETGTYAWLYDEDRWPSGYAGGAVPLMDEAYRSRALVFVEEGTQEETDSTLAHATMDGRQYAICMRVSQLGSLWFNKTSYVDLMNPEAVKAFLTSTHEKYKAACGQYFGREIPGIFTDEPCYLMKIEYKVPVVPWSEYLPAHFEKLHGYSILQHLPELFLDTGEYRKIRYDFYRCATMLLMESFTKQYYQWCNENNLIMTGHFMAEDNLAYQTEWVGGVMPQYEFMHWPGVDKLGRSIEQLVTVKQLTSVTDQLNKERALSEVFGCVGQQVSFYHRKWIADWQAALGVNFINHHLSLYSMRGVRKRDYPANLFYPQPWWDEEKCFSEYLGRVNYAATVGCREVHNLVIHPLGSAWAEFSPLDKKNRFSFITSRYNQPFEELSKQLMANKHDFHYGDEIIMESHASVKDGKLIIGEYAYDTVIVPPCSILQPNTKALLETFSRQAGSNRLIVLQGAQRADLPKHRLLDTIADVVKALNEDDAERITVTDRITGQNAAEVFVHKRILEQGAIVFITNTDKDREINVKVHLPYTKDVKVMDLMNGEIYSAPVCQTRNGVDINMLMYPAGSILLALDSAMDETRELPIFIQSGVSFPTDMRRLASIDRWTVTALEDNVLPLEDITLYMDGKKVLDHQPISMAWHEHFFPAEDGTPYAVEYSFDVEALPQGACYAAIESADNLDRITLNGKTIQPIKRREEANVFASDKTWKDVSFLKVPITDSIVIGKNTFRLEGKKMNNITGAGFHIRVNNAQQYRSTELEAVYIIGDFYVESYGQKEFAITARKPIRSGTNLTEDGYPFYAGKMSYRTEVECDAVGKSLLLEIDNANCACIHLKVNGDDVGTQHWYPFIFDVSGAIRHGKNDIEIIASTTLFNVMGPNRTSGILGDNYIDVGLNSFIAHERFTRRRELMPFGLGKAHLYVRDTNKP